MSGFKKITALRKIQAEGQKSEKNFYYKHIVVGDNTKAVITFLRLKAEFGQENVLLISPRPLNQETIINEWNTTLYPLRGEDNFQKVQHLAQDYNIDLFENEVHFYKDGKIHSFNGRAKSMELKKGESLFVKPSYAWDWKKFFISDDFDHLNTILEQSLRVKILKEVEFTKALDLLKPANFKLHTGDEESFECENLHWAQGEKELLSALLNKENLQDEFIQYLSGLETSAFVCVYFKCDREIHSTKGTVFLPQSASHEEGHFIVQFMPADSINHTQELMGMILLGEEEVGAEELAKKIHAMKRVMQRVFPELQKANYTECIRYANEMKLSDDLSGPELVRNIYPELHLVTSMLGAHPGH